MKQRKRVLFLGGSHFQVPAIRYAKSQGYYTITCDYLPDNPGHQYADEYHNISTTDKEQILKIAGELKIDGIVAYASDPAAPTAAYVGNKLNLPTNPYGSIEILTHKDLYRDFLKNNGFNVPKAKGVDTLQDALEIFPYFSGPVIVKPVDSSGSKGVSKVSEAEMLPDAFNYAMSFSCVKKVIMEQFIEKKGPQIGGDGFVDNGQLLFICLGDQKSDEKCNQFVPVGMSFPTCLEPDIQNRIISEIERAVKALKIKSCALNIEVMLDKHDNIYLMEIGPRNGGNFLPEVIRYYTGVDLIKSTVEAAIGNAFTGSTVHNPGIYAYYAIHSEQDGVFRSIDISDELKCKILEQHIFKSSGDGVKKYNGSNCTIGIALLRFESDMEMNYMINNMNDHLNVNIE